MKACALAVLAAGTTALPFRRLGPLGSSLSAALCTPSCPPWILLRLGSPKAMLSAMEQLKSTGSWLTALTCIRVHM